MAVNFFEREVKKAWHRFNQAFGNQATCNLQIRYSALLAICWLGVLGKRILEAKDKEKVRDLTQEFTSRKKTLNNFFTQIEKGRRQPWLSSTNMTRKLADGC